jgi:hypothetical protein
MRSSTWWVAAAVVLLIVSLGASARLLKDDASPIAAATATDATPRASNGTLGAQSTSAIAGRQTPPAAPTGVATTAKRLTALRVEHRHRIGGCRGVLTVSRTGIAFVPDPTSRRTDDAFRLGYGAFFHELDDDGDLVLRSSGKTYRFKALVSDGINGGDQVLKLVTTMAQLR